MKYLIAFLIGTIFLIMLILALHDEDQRALAKIKPPDITECPPIFHAGAHIIYRCVDDENDNIIYANDLGFQTWAGK